MTAVLPWRSRSWDPGLIARRDLLGLSLLALLPAGVRAAALPPTDCVIGTPRLSAQRIAPDGTVEVAVDIANPGSRPAALVARAYIHDHVASVARPALNLAAALPVTLQPGESRTVRFVLGPAHFRLPLPGEKHIVEPGLFDIMVGTDSSDLQSATLEIA